LKRFNPLKADKEASACLVLGATSAIAQMTIRELAHPGARFFLVAKDDAKLQAVAKDLRVCGCEVETLVADLNDCSRHQPIICRGSEFLRSVELAMLAHGVLGDNALAERSVEHARQIFETNALSYISLLIYLAQLMETQKRGTIAVMTSVAGDRGRRSNYVYGASKAATIVFLQGLRARLHPVGVRVLDIRLGPIDTPMTAHMPKTWLFASAVQAGKAISRSILESRADIVYFPGRWRLIMTVIRLLPESLSKRLNY
jgi:short-subunit dehydrogenase